MDIQFPFYQLPQGLHREIIGLWASLAVDANPLASWTMDSDLLGTRPDDEDPDCPEWTWELPSGDSVVLWLEPDGHLCRGLSHGMDRSGESSLLRYHLHASVAFAFGSPEFSIDQSQASIDEEYLHGRKFFVTGYLDRAAQKIDETDAPILPSAIDWERAIASHFGEDLRASQALAAALPFCSGPDPVPPWIVSRLDAGGLLVTMGAALIRGHAEAATSLAMHPIATAHTPHAALAHAFQASSPDHHSLFPRANALAESIELSLVSHVADPLPTPVPRRI